MVLNIQIEFFQVVRPCSVVVEYQCFRGPYCIHLQGKMLVYYYNTTQHHNPEEFNTRVLETQWKFIIIFLNKHNFENKFHVMGHRRIFIILQRISVIFSKLMERLLQGQWKISVFL
jgi:hypothetical protein